jgi:NAD(P)-dependent dehydrogenase (short-subunit alcohol dehydrogenase family)
MTNERLQLGRVAIVVGAAGELGRATALKLAERGITVVAVDRDQPGLEALPNNIVRQVVDATDPNASAPMLERFVRDVGLPDVLVNTIGAFQVGGALNTTPDLLRLMIEVNLGSALWLSQAVAPYMERNVSGAIVHWEPQCVQVAASLRALFRRSREYMVQPTRTTSQKLTKRKISTDPSASAGFNPEATSPAVSTASVTPKPPGVRLKLLAVTPAQ